MRILINGRNATLKKGSSFEYVSENRMFSGSDAYTLAITFPLKDCPENIAIFGNINRSDIQAAKLIFDCELRDRDFLKFGTITITDISETEVKCQFLEGRSEQNFDSTFDKVYINELNLGAPSVTDKSKISPVNAWDPAYNGNKYVALPWVNNESGNIQNLADYVEDTIDGVKQPGRYIWNEDCTGLSWQPYLLEMTKRICQAEQVGYSFDFSNWEDKEEYKYLLICNTLPNAWDMPEFASALPHWNVDEYFDKLGLFLGGEFDIDHRAKHISFRFTRDIITSKKPVRLENIVDEYASEVKVTDDKCEYSEAKNLVYKDCEHQMWKFYSCDWFMEAYKEKVVRYSTLSELLENNKRFYDTNNQFRVDPDYYTPYNKLLYAEDQDAYFVFLPVDKKITHLPATGLEHITYICRLQPINMFAGRIVNINEDAEQQEIEFVPACIDDTEAKYGRMLFLSFSEYDDIEVDDRKVSEGGIPTTRLIALLSAGEREKKIEFYDRIYIGWFDGSNAFKGTRLPYPNVEDIVFADDMSNYAKLHFSLRLRNNLDSRLQIIHSINPKVKVTFKFLADSIPDVRSVFHIRGKLYICEKITATYTEEGMSQLLKGEFYPLQE